MLNAISAAGTSKITKVKKLEPCSSGKKECTCAFCMKKKEIVNFGFKQNLVEEVMKDAYGG